MKPKPTQAIITLCIGQGRRAMEGPHDPHTQTHEGARAIKVSMRFSFVCLLTFIVFSAAHGPPSSQLIFDLTCFHLCQRSLPQKKHLLHYYGVLHQSAFLYSINATRLSRTSSPLSFKSRSFRRSMAFTTFLTPSTPSTRRSRNLPFLKLMSYATLSSE